MKTKFKIGDKVWPIQKKESGWEVSEKLKVNVIIDKILFFKGFDGGTACHEKYCFKMKAEAKKRCKELNDG